MHVEVIDRRAFVPGALRDITELFNKFHRALMNSCETTVRHSCRHGAPLESSGRTALEAARRYTLLLLMPLLVLVVLLMLVFAAAVPGQRDGS